MNEKELEERLVEIFHYIQDKAKGFRTKQDWEDFCGDVWIQFKADIGEEKVENWKEHADQLIESHRRAMPGLGVPIDKISGLASKQDKSIEELEQDAKKDPSIKPDDLREAYVKANDLLSAFYSKGRWADAVWHYLKRVPMYMLLKGRRYKKKNAFHMLELWALFTEYLKKDDSRDSYLTAMKSADDLLVMFVTLFEGMTFEVPRRRKVNVMENRMELYEKVVKSCIPIKKVQVLNVSKKKLDKTEKERLLEEEKKWRDEQDKHPKRGDKHVDTVLEQILKLSIAEINKVKVYKS